MWPQMMDIDELFVPISSKQIVQIIFDIFANF